MVLKIKIISLIILPFFFLPLSSFAAKAPANLAGYILLQVEEHGEAWYISPETLMRHYLGRPQNALEIMRARGTGITNSDLIKIPVGLSSLTGNDGDKDGLPDNLELALGINPNNPDTDNDGFTDYMELKTNNNPLGSGFLAIDKDFSNRNAGKIFLQVESRGEAWYVNPGDSRRYYLGRPDEALNIMSSLGLGISNKDLENITSLTRDYNISGIEELIFNKINIERKNRLLNELAWNNEVASVAREHSSNLARENNKFTGINQICDYPIIHHEGLDFGLYVGDRLNNRGVYYYSRGGENIALMSAAKFKVSFLPSDQELNGIDACHKKQLEWEDEFRNILDTEENNDEKLAIINAEINKRTQEINRSKAINIEDIEWYSEEFISDETVDSWMNSPGHLENIIEPGYDETGIGTAYVNGYLISTQVFIKRAECGFNGGACCTKQGYYPYCYVGLECKNDICG